MNRFGLTDKDFFLVEKVFREFSSIDEVIIFGSRAMGNEKPGSDIDFAIKGKKVDSSVVSQLHSQLEEEISVPYFFDIIDYSTITNPALKTHIDHYGKIFYSNKF